MAQTDRQMTYGPSNLETESAPRADLVKNFNYMNIISFAKCKGPNITGLVLKMYFSSLSVQCVDVHEIAGNYSFRRTTRTHLDSNQDEESLNDTKSF